MDELSPAFQEAIHDWAERWSEVAVVEEYEESFEIAPSNPRSTGIKLAILGESDEQINLALGDNGTCELFSRKGQDDLIQDVLFLCDAARLGGITEQQRIKKGRAVASKITIPNWEKGYKIYTSQLHLPFGIRVRTVNYGPY